MPAVSFCPSGEELKQFARGTLEPAAAGRIIQHLQQCRACLSVLEGEPIDDTLIEALRKKGAAAFGGDKAALEGLIPRLKKLAVAAAPDPEATAADAPVAKTDRLDFLSPPQGEGEIGRLGGYRVLQVLGSGGMGVVLAAEDVRLKRKVALKVMRPELAANEGAKLRFLREAESCAAVRSDHVITIYQVGEQGDAPFLAMEYLEGMSLDDWLKKGRKPTLTQAARMGRQIALGLAAAHERGLIHRDIKPGNIWLESSHQGRVKLLDFGLARGTADEIHLTQSGAIVGTPAYMAPEQARGEHVDPRCDLFSLGVVLYRLTTGRLPFRGDNTMSILTSLAMDTPMPPRDINSDISPRLAALIEGLLSKDREQRPKTAKAVADELAIIEREAAQPAQNEPTVQFRAASAPVVRAAHAAQGSKRRRWLVAASLLLVLGGAAAAIVVIIRDKQGKEVARLSVPEGHNAEIVDDTKGKDEAKGRPEPKAGVRIEPEPLPLLRPGEPLSPWALVTRPAKLAGVRSWSIVSREAESPSAFAYRPDGRRLAIASWNGTVHVWETETGRLVQVILTPGTVPSLAWSPDGRVLAVGTGKENRWLHLWDADTGRLLRVLEAPVAEFLRSLAWSPDGRKVRAWGEWQHCCTWDVAQGKLLHALPIACKSPTFSPDSQRFAGIVDGKRVVVWDADTGKEVSRMDAPVGVGCLAWSPDGKRLACTGGDGLRVWDVETHKQPLLYPKAVYRYHVPAWSPDGRSLAVSLDASKGLQVIDAASAKELRLLALGGMAAWSPDGTTIAIVTTYQTRLYDATTGQPRRTLTERALYNKYAWLPKGPFMAVTEKGQDAKEQTALASVDSGQIAAVFKNTPGPQAWSPDGKRLAAAGPNQTIVVREEGDKLRTTLIGHRQDVSWLAWSPDGKRLASSSAGEKGVLLWDADKGEKIRELGPFAAPTESVAWSPDGRLVAFSVPGIGWHFWDVEQNKLANDPKKWQGSNLLFAPDGRFALLDDAGSFYHLRDVATGKEHGQKVGPTYRNEPAWSPDGRLLAVRGEAHYGGTVELWRGDLSRRVRTLWATQTIDQVGFSADGKIVAGRADDRLHLWETDTGRLRGILLLGERQNALAITPDGHYTGNDKVERGIVMVVQKDDGIQELVEPADFETKYGFKNEPNKVHLLKPLPPPLYPLPAMPLGPQALVREPAELPDAQAMSWTIETVAARGQVKALAYRPDGKLLAAGGEDGVIRIWDTVDGKLVRMLVGDAAQSLWWSKDGKVLSATGRKPGEARQWQVDTGRPLGYVAETAKPAMTTARSPDGKQTATINKHGIHLHDAASGERVRTLETARSVIPALSLSADGRRLLLGNWRWDPMIVVDTTTGQPLPSPPEAVFDGAWSPDGKFLAAAAPGGRVRLWNAVTREPVRTLEGRLVGHLGRIAWSADSKKVAAANSSHLWVWSAETGKILWHNDKQQGASRVAWSPQGRWLATSDMESNKVGIWEADSGKLLHETSIFAWDLSWSPDGKTLAVGSAGPTRIACRLIDAASGAVRLNMIGGLPRWSADGKTLITSGWWGLTAWDAATGAEQGVVKHAVPPWLALWAPGGWSADGRVLARCNGYEIHLCDGDGRPLGVLLWGERSAQLVITADGQYRGNARVERLIRMVVQKSDGTTETLTPREFEQKYHFKNEPDKVRLIDK